MDDFEQFDYYAILGVSRSATAEEIKRAYRQQIARFHPDRFTAATAEEQAYASRRAQRINEAYAALGDFQERVAYNRSLPPEAAGQARAPRQPAAAPAASRDHLAELYEQARAHLAAGRNMQAAATLREIQQLNPFYRDSAALLAQAEAAVRPAARPVVRPAPASAPPPDWRRRTIVVGGLGAVVLAGLGAAGWLLRGRAAEATLGVPTSVVGSEPSITTAAPASTGGASTPVPATAAPTAAPPSPPAIPTAVPTTLPTTVAPTVPAAPTVVTIAEEGELLYADDFSGRRGWPTLGGTGWSVGFAPGGYRITAAEGAGNIWAFNTAPAGLDYLVGVDVVASGGMGGLLLRYSEAGYLAFLLDPALGSYKLERRDSAGISTLIEEGHPAIGVGPDTVNRLAARLEGSTLVLRINGQPVYATDLASPPRSAQYGLVAVARGPEVVATFANLALRAL